LVGIISAYIFFKKVLAEVKDKSLQQLLEKEMEIERLTEQNGTLLEQIEEAKEIMLNEFKLLASRLWSVTARGLATSQKRE